MTDKIVEDLIQSGFDALKSVNHARMAEKDSPEVIKDQEGAIIGGTLDLLLAESGGNMYETGIPSRTRIPGSAKISIFDEGTDVSFVPHTLDLKNDQVGDQVIKLTKRGVFIFSSVGDGKVGATYSVQSDLYNEVDGWGHQDIYGNLNLLLDSPRATEESVLRCINEMGFRSLGRLIEQTS